MEWWNGGMVEWWNGRMVEWWNGGMAEWRKMKTRNGCQGMLRELLVQRHSSA